MGKGSHGAARPAQKARNSAKKNNNTKSSSVDSADHLAQSNKVAEEGNPEPPKSPKGSPEAPFTRDVLERSGEDQERNTTDLTTSTDTHPTSPDKIPEPEVIASRSPDPSEPTSNSNDGEVISLREQVRALENELQELQQTLAESHQAFAEQIVQMSATKDQEKDTEIAQLQQNWERSQSDLQVQTERVHALEKQLEDRDKALETKSSTEAEHSTAMADMQAKISVRVQDSYPRILYWKPIHRPRSPWKKWPTTWDTRKNQTMYVLCSSFTVFYGESAHSSC